MKRNGWIWWVIAAIIAIILLICAWNLCDKWKARAEKECNAIELMEGLHNQNEALKRENAKLMLEKDSLQKLVDGLTRALADCQEGKPATKPKVVAKKISPPPAAKQTAPTVVAPVKKTETPSPVPVTAEDYSREKSKLLEEDENKDDNVFYEPVITGDVGNTLYDYGFILFYISDRLFQTYATIPAPLFNTRTGIPFVKEGNYWVFRSRIKGKLGGYFNWCVYVGQNQEYGFHMFLPHEWQKRGGPDIKALIEADMVRPNGIADADGVTEGWEYFFPLTGTAGAVSKAAGNIAP